MTLPDLRVWIQAHPSRAELHSRLTAILGEALPVSLSLHSSTPPDPWAGYKQVVRRAVDGEGTHFVVLQDDVTLCRDFPRAVRAAVDDRPNEVLSLWVGGLRQPTTKLFRQAQISGQRWVQIHFSDIHHVVALVWPRWLAEEFLDWTENNMLPGDGRNQQSDDAIVGAWARRTKRYFIAHVPCLVEHEDDVESTIGRARGDAGRRAIAFAGR